MQTWFLPRWQMDREQPKYYFCQPPKQSFDRLQHFLWLVNAWAFKSLRANTENLPALHSRPFSPDGLIRITVFPILWISVLQSAEQRLHTEFTISSLTVRFLTHGCFSIIAPVGQTTAHWPQKSNPFFEWQSKLRRNNSIKSATDKT